MSKYECQVFMGTRIMVRNDPVRRLYNIWVTNVTDRHIAYATNIEFKVVEEGSLIPEPLLNLDETDAQGLMNELWKAGVRPTEEGTIGQLEAVKYHLEDMRSLVFGGKKK